MEKTELMEKKALLEAILELRDGVAQDMAKAFVDGIHVGKRLAEAAARAKEEENRDPQ